MECLFPFCHDWLNGTYGNSSKRWTDYGKPLDAVTKSDGLNVKSLIRGSKDRFRAVMLTTVSTSAGMIPTIYGLGGHQPFLVPLVLAVAGGLIFGTVITLILIPLVYSLKLREAV